jgi:hypothetical protein
VTLPAGRYRFGPDNSRLIVKTYREGVAAKVGHDLVIEVEQWDASLELSGDSSILELHADPRSLVPRDGVGGVKPLTDRDRDEIRQNIEEKILGAQSISFRSNGVGVAQSSGGLSASGELTIQGRTRPSSFELHLASDGTISASAVVVQSEWGIRPYRGLMGALRVRDAVEIVFEGTPASA